MSECSHDSMDGFGVEGFWICCQCDRFVFCSTNDGMTSSRVVTNRELAVATWLSSAQYERLTGEG